MSFCHSIVHALLLPLSGLYGAGVLLRNMLYDRGILHAYTCPIPIITVGNITVGGTGKTPLIEYLIRLLADDHRIAVLSRGYKRKSKGFVRATADSTMAAIGDEPYQIKRKYPAVDVAVDKNRQRAIQHFLNGDGSENVEVFLLDDAYQYRRVKSGLSILLIDYHRPINGDQLLPAGRLREPRRAVQRADIVVITKCPHTLTSDEYVFLSNQISLLPQQKLFFTAIEYKVLQPYNGGDGIPLSSLHKDETLLLVAGIARPAQAAADLAPYAKTVRTIAYGDHHYFTAQDIAHINSVYASIDGKKRIITTEKDAARLRQFAPSDLPFINDIYILPIETTFLRGQQEEFNDIIKTYITQNKKQWISRR